MENLLKSNPKFINETNHLPILFGAEYITWLFYFYSSSSTIYNTLRVSCPTYYTIHLLSKAGNPTPIKCVNCDKTAYVWALDYQQRSFAIDDQQSRGRAL